MYRENYEFMLQDFVENLPNECMSLLLPDFKVCLNRFCIPQIDALLSDTSCQSVRIGGKSGMHVEATKYTL